MPKDPWAEDASRRSITLQQRSEAVANDTTPRPEDIPALVLVRRVGDGWLEAKVPEVAKELIASGEYRPFTATEGYTDSGTLCCQADPEWVEFSRKERITALVTQQVREEMDEMTARIALMSDEEIDALESSLMEAGSSEVQP